jgi:hypothetical protein
LSGPPRILRPIAIGAAALAVVALASRLWGQGVDHRSDDTGVSISTEGPPQTVFDWSSQACAPDQLPDLPVRAFRDYRGRVDLILPHFNSWLLTGPDLNHLGNPCHVVLGSSFDPNPAGFNQKEWIASLYTRDGRRVAALVHDEYHGAKPGTCSPRDLTSCWYNAVTYASSSDGGLSFTQLAAPNDLVAASPEPYSPGRQPSGVFSPSNIVRSPADGLYYAIALSRTPSGDTGSCLMRTGDPFDPASWRAWDGSGFGFRFTDPYRAAGAGGSDCTPVATPEIASMHESLTYNTSLQRYLLVGLASAPEAETGRSMTGVYFSLSTDLLHWTRRQLIVAAPSVQSFRCGGPDPIAYPSLIDPSSRSRTFSTTARRPYLYYTRFNYQGCHRSPDRDLVRVPIAIAGP